MGIESFFPVQVAAWLETIGPGAFERNICVNSSLHAPPFPSTIGAHPLPCSLPPPQRRQTCDGGKLVAVAVAVAASQERSPACYPTPLPSSALPSTIDVKNFVYCADALAVAVLVKKMFRMSDTVIELVMSSHRACVSSLHRICKKCSDDVEFPATAAARRVTVVEAVQVGVFQNVMMLLQVGCREATKEKATVLLKVDDQV